MATLTVWRFPSASGAEDAEFKLKSLQAGHLITIQDAAVLSWPADATKPKTRQLRNLTGSGALGGTFWGLLFGILFFMPLLGMAIGAATGAVAGALTDAGIDEDFIASVRDKVTPGSSALFLLSSDAVIDKVREEFAGVEAELLQTNLSAEQEAALRAVFAD